MNSETSTERPRGPRADSTFQAWHFYFILAMAGATWAVVASRHTQPAALIMLSATILAAGAAGAALHQALAGLFGLGPREAAPIGGRVRADLERQKALVLRSIKELEFDHAMRKVSDADFAEIGGRLRARAMELLQQLENVGADTVDTAPTASPLPQGECATCHTANDRDARFCKRCGSRLS